MHLPFYFLHSNGDSEILKQKTEDVELKKYALSIMDKTGSFAYTKQVMESCYENISQMVQELGGNEKLSAIVEYLHKNQQ